MNCSQPIRACLLVAASLAAAAPSVRQPPDGLSLEPFLVTRLGFTTAQVASVRRGQAAVVVLPSGVNREVAVAGAVRVNSTPERLADLLQDVERLESGPGFLKTRKTSDPPRLEDFDDLELPPRDVAALRKCRPGKCEVKLGQGAFDLLARIDWNAPDATARVNQLARRTSLEYLTAYRKGGNQELAIYLDSGRPQFIAAEFRDIVGHSRFWPETLRPLSDVLLGYPTAPQPPGMHDFFYWSLAEFGLKPLVRLNHVIVYPTGRPGGPLYAVAVKQLYASHYFRTALEMRVVFAEGTGAERAIYLVVLNAARSDGFTGLFGGLVKSRARSGSRDGLQKALAAIKRMAEQAPRSP